MTTIKIVKAALLQTIIERLQKEVADIRIGFEEARRTSIESPGRMQSRYDTMGVEAAWVADGLAKNLQIKTGGLARLKALRLPASPTRGALELWLASVRLMTTSIPCIHSPRCWWTDDRRRRSSPGCASRHARTSRREIAHNQGGG